MDGRNVLKVSDVTVVMELRNVVGAELVDFVERGGMPVGIEIHERGKRARAAAIRAESVACGLRRMGPAVTTMSLLTTACFGSLTGTISISELRYSTPAHIAAARSGCVSYAWTLFSGNTTFSASRLLRPCTPQPRMPTRRRVGPRQELCGDRGGGAGALGGDPGAVHQGKRHAGFGVVQNEQAR